MSPSMSAKPLLLPGLTRAQSVLKLFAVPSKIARHGAVTVTRGGLGNTESERRSTVRRASATPVSIGFGEPSAGNSAGPAT